MRLRWKMTLAAGIVVAMAVAGYAEFVADIRAPRSSLAKKQAIEASLAVRTADFQRAQEDMKRKWGPRAQTSVEASGVLTTTVYGKVVQQSNLPAQFYDASGLFVIGPPGQLASTFPFHIDPHKDPDEAESSEPLTALKSRLGVEFNDEDAVPDTCVALSASDLGRLGALLRLETGTFCVVYWRGASPASMVIGVMLAHGDPWMRPFSERICRSLTSIALRRVASVDRTPPPDYAGCVLVDRPDRSEVGQMLRAHVYEVRRDSTLARIN
jgi:hypothetical protein